MTGRQLAENLRNSKETWAKGNYYVPEAEGFCIIGLKAYEAGISKETLLNVTSFLSVYQLKSLSLLNDAARSKEQLIEWLEKPLYADHDFPIEKFIRKLKQFYPEGKYYESQSNSSPTAQ